MKVFYFFSVMGGYFSKLSAELQQTYGVTNFSGMLYGKDQRTDTQKTGFPWQKIWVFTEYFTAHSSTGGANLAYLAECERRYGPPNLNLLIAGDRFACGFSGEKSLKLLEASFRMCEKALEAHQPDVIVSESVSCMLSYALYLVARRRGIPFMAIVPSRIPGRVAIVRNPYDRFEAVEAEFVRLKQTEMTASERGSAEEFLTRFGQSKMKPDYMRPEYQLRISSRQDLFALVDMFRRYRQDPDNYLTTHPVTALRNRLVRNARYWLSNRKLFESPVAGEKFVLFPLHFQPEASTLIRAPFYLDQLSLIENIAKSIPIDHKLYVKEHSVSVGKRPASYYQRIKSIGNVRLISPYVESHDLIRQASAVLSITGTLGWEAVLYEVPVITFGDAFYNAFDLVYRARDVRLLPDLISEAITHFRPDRELLLKFIAAMFLGTYEGFRPSTDSYVLTDENIRRVARALVAELNLERAGAAKTLAHAEGFA